MPAFQSIPAQIAIANRGGQLWRYQTLDGVQYIVAPVAMLANGVWSGSQGPTLYPPDVLAKFALSWNHKPVVVAHPTEQGFAGMEYVSANTPERLNRSRVGIILNARYDQKTEKLRAEAWINPESLKRVAPAVLDAILSNQALEISTGLWSDGIPQQGTFNGKAYRQIASNMIPDHLAILTDSVGAYSIADGGGLLVANHQPNSYFEALHRGDMPPVADPCPAVPLPRLVSNAPPPPHADPDYLPLPKMFPDVPPAWF